MAEKTYYLDVGFNNNSLKNFVVDPLAADPGTGVAGRLIYNNVLKKIKYFDGTAWKPIGADNLNDLSDTDFTGWSDSTNDQYLVYDAPSKTWKPRSIKSTIELQSDYSTTGTSGKLDGQIMTWDSGTNQWTNKPAPGGVSMTNADVNRLVLSGANNTAPLTTAGDDLRYDGWGLVVKATASGGVFGHIKIDTENFPTKNGSYASLVFGSKSTGDPDRTAVIRCIASEDHSTGNKGTAMSFETARQGTNSPLSTFVITQTGSLYVNPTTTVQDIIKPNTHFHVNGSVSNKVRGTTASPYAVQSDDSYIICNSNAKGANMIVNLPTPNDSNEGRVVTIKNAGGVTPPYTTNVVGAIYSVGHGASFLLRTGGSSAEFMSCLIDGSYAWAVMNQG